MYTPALGSESIVLQILLGFLSLYIVRTVWLFARLRHFSGPFLAGFSDWPHSKAMLQNNCHEWYAKVIKEHGM